MHQQFMFVGLSYICMAVINELLNHLISLILQHQMHPKNILTFLSEKGANVV